MEAVSLAALHDRMTEQHYPEPIQSFSPQSTPAPLNGSINILAEGRSALEKANRELGEQEPTGHRGKGLAWFLGRHGPWWPEACCQLSRVCLPGLALDSWDLDFYTKRFQQLQRNPSTVEAFDLAQSNR